jgi:hypothetical protein
VRKGTEENHEYLSQDSRPPNPGPPVSWVVACIIVNSLVYCALVKLPFCVGSYGHYFLYMNLMVAVIVRIRG